MSEEQGFEERSNPEQHENYNQKPQQPHAPHHSAIHHVMHSLCSSRISVQPMGSATEPAWKEYADTFSGVGEQMQGLHQTMFETMGTASWQGRRNLMNQMFQARQQAFGTVQEAATKLITALSPAQKAKAQSILPGFPYGRGMMGQR